MKENMNNRETRRGLLVIDVIGEPRPIAIVPASEPTGRVQVISSIDCWIDEWHRLMVDFPVINERVEVSIHLFECGAFEGSIDGASDRYLWDIDCHPDRLEDVRVMPRSFRNLGQLIRAAVARVRGPLGVRSVRGRENRFGCSTIVRGDTTIKRSYKLRSAASAILSAKGHASEEQRAVSGRYALDEALDALKEESMTSACYSPVLHPIDDLFAPYGERWWKTSAIQPDGFLSWSQIGRKAADRWLDSEHDVSSCVDTDQFEYRSFGNRPEMQIAHIQGLPKGQRITDCFKRLRPFDIVNFVRWIGIGHARTSILVSAAVLLLAAITSPGVQGLGAIGIVGLLSALYMSVGGGVLTKKGDRLNLTGTVESGWNEDKRRLITRKATMFKADNVGNNVGDCAGVVSDVFESYLDALVSMLERGAHFDLESWCCPATDKSGPTRRYWSPCKAHVAHFVGIRKILLAEGLLMLPSIRKWMPFQWEATVAKFHSHHAKRRPLGWQGGLLAGI